MPGPSDHTPNPAPGGGGKRMSTGIKLVLMGVAGAALLYSCAPGIGSGLGAMPYLWFFSNPFFRGQSATAPPNSQLSPGTTTRPGGTVTTPGSTATPHGTTTPSGPSTRGGFGGSAGTHGTTSS